MSDPALTLDVLVSPFEQNAVVAGAEQVSDALAESFGFPPPIQLRFLPASSATAAGAAPALVASPLFDLHPLDRPFPHLEELWRGRIGAAAAAGKAIVLLTGFRHVAASADRAAILDRIRRGNRMVIDLSHATGARVADVDRALSFFGGRTVEADVRLGSAKAVEIAGHAIAGALLDAAPDLGPRQADWQAAADRHGTLFTMAAAVERRLATKAARRPA